MLRTLARGLLDLLYPGICAACGRSLLPDESHFCTSCRAILTGDSQPVCPRCASTIGPFANVEGGCSRCRDDVFHFERALRLGTYEGLLRDLILRMKKSSGETLAELLANLWAQARSEALKATGATAVVAVPLHWRRRWRRGYDQSAVLGEVLAHHLKIPFQRRRLRRVRHTPFQTAQTPAARRENVRGVFRAEPRADLRGSIILLVDDVLTTGSTASEAARALRSAGAAKVIVAVLAHGPS